MLDVKEVQDFEAIDHKASVISAIRTGSTLPTSLAYLYEGASRFYDIYSRGAGKRPHDKALADMYWPFLLKAVDPEKAIHLISLGCGNAWRESAVIEKMAGRRMDDHYVGVDSSAAMLREREAVGYHVAPSHNRIAP